MCPLKARSRAAAAAVADMGTAWKVSMEKAWHRWNNARKVDWYHPSRLPKRAAKVRKDVMRVANKARALGLEYDSYVLLHKTMLPESIPPLPPPPATPAKAAAAAAAAAAASTPLGFLHSAPWPPSWGGQRGLHSDGTAVAHLSGDPCLAPAMRLARNVAHRRERRVRNKEGQQLTGDIAQREWGPAGCCEAAPSLAWEEDGKPFGREAEAYVRFDLARPPVEGGEEQAKELANAQAAADAAEAAAWQIVEAAEAAAASQLPKAAAAAEARAVAAAKAAAAVRLNATLLEATFRVARMGSEVQLWQYTKSS